jgi:hypothetical protein
VFDEKFLSNRAGTHVGTTERALVNATRSVPGFGEKDRVAHYVFDHAKGLPAIGHADIIVLAVGGRVQGFLRY